MMPTMLMINVIVMTTTVFFTFAFFSALEVMFLEMNQARHSAYSALVLGDEGQII